MAEFPKAILTDAGKQMIARAQMGEKLIFTRGKYGEGQLVGSDNVESLVDLKSPKLTLPIQEMSNPQNGQTTITLLIDREPLQGGFWGRELGLFAKIEESGAEKLFCYTNAGTQADYIAKTDSVVSEFIDIDTIVGNVAALEVVIDKTKVYVTKEQLEDHQTDPKAHKEIFDKMSTGVPVGTIIAYAGTTVPAGFLECNGAILSRTIYAGLFKAIGTLWGSTASNNFKLPNTYEAARFLRGRSSSLSVGTVQEDAIRNIVGGVNSGAVEESGASAYGAFALDTTLYPGPSSGNKNYGFSFDASRVVPTAEENRPKSAVVMYCIKYADEVTNKEQVDFSEAIQEIANCVKYKDYEAKYVSENYVSIVLPNGYMLLQAKYVHPSNLSNDTEVEVVFPFAFLETPFVLLSDTAGVTSGSSHSEGAMISSINISSFKFFSRWASVSVSNSEYNVYRYFAIGRVR